MGLPGAYVFSIEADLTGIDLLEAGQHIDESRLARAVRADETENLRSGEPEAHPLERAHTLEIDVDVGDGELRGD
jgi:hypothetical protein